MTKTLTPEIVSEIKTRLWAGETQDAVAKSMKVSTPLIGNIRSGARWGAVPWPNGRTGALSKSRRTEITKARKGAKEKLMDLVREDLA